MKKLVAALLALSLVILSGSAALSPASAQTAPAWQSGATGLRTSSDTDKRTAGLSFIVRASGAPSLSLQGGVKPGGSGKIVSSTIDLGLVRVAGRSHALAAESADWSHNEMTFSGELKVWVSRLSPTVLVQSQAPIMSFLAGPVKGTTWTGRGVIARADAPSYPKYVAFSSGGEVRVERLSGVEMSLPELDDAWLLVWYGENSHFADTKVPLSYSDDLGWGFASLPEAYGYKADAPVLFTFENKPQSIKHSGEGGVEVRFPTASGNTLLMPLLGLDHPPAAETEVWAGGLPDEITSKARFWAARIGAFPTGVVESYSYDAGSDRATVTESISYLQAVPGAVPFSAIPPALGTTILGGNSLGITTSGPLVDPGYPTAFGPLMGIDGTARYSWSIPGLRRYTDARRVTGPGSVPLELQQELALEVQKVADAGHLKPWVFSDALPRNEVRGDIYFLNPSDSLYHLAEVARAMPEGTLASRLIDYLRAERSQYPPESVANLPDEGSVRGPFGLGSYGSWSSARPDVFSKKVPLYSHYGLASYHELTGDPVPAELVAQAGAALDESLAEQDWASMSWFKGFGEKHTAVENSNRHLAGITGFVKLAHLAGDGEAEARARVILAKAAVARVAVARYPSYLYQAGLIQLPGSPWWQAEQTAGSWAGFTANYSWSGPAQDPRQVAVMDQFGSVLLDHSGYMAGWSDWVYRTSAHLSAFRDVIPEVYALLRDHARQEALTQVEKYTAAVPNWYAAYSEAAFGGEHNLNHPSDSYQIFMAKALIEGASAQELERYLDIPWIETGDLFYLQKLAETIRAYRGDRWEDAGGPQ